MLKRLLPLGIFCLLAVSCGDTQPQPQPKQAVPAKEEPAPPAPPELGQKGGLPDDRTPVSEAPSSEKSAQGAAQVLQTYFALIVEGQYDAAWKLRWKGQGDDAESAAAFAASFDRYAEYHASVGAPGAISGAAGSLYVDVPIQIYGRTKDGKPFATAGTMTLRRVNEVPGSTAEERRWRIYSRD